MPVGAGTPRYEKPELWFGTANRHGGFCHAPPDPSGGQAPALHFLIPPPTIGLQFGTFRPGRAGIEVDLGAHFRTNDGTGTSNGSRLFSYKCPECGPSGSSLAIMISGDSGSRH